MKKPIVENLVSDSLEATFELALLLKVHVFQARRHQPYALQSYCILIQMSTNTDKPCRELSGQVSP
jgi:hypothetical protein